MTHADNAKRNKTISAQATKLYAKGKSIREISEATGASYGKIHRLLNEAGVALRPRGGSRPKSAKA